MSIRRAPRPSRCFTTLPNATLEDRRMSWEAQGLLTFVLAKPDNWSINVAQLTKVGSAGRDKVYKILAELEQHGYLHREQGRQADSDKGRFGKFEYVLFDTPQQEGILEEREPLTENTEAVDSAGADGKSPVTDIQEAATPVTDLPLTDLPDTAKPTLTKNISKQELSSNKPPKSPNEKKSTRACQLPEDWQPLKRHVKKAQQLGCQGTKTFMLAFEQFKTHHRAKGSTMKCWDSAFDTWLMNCGTKFGWPELLTEKPYQNKTERQRVSDRLNDIYDTDW